MSFACDPWVILSPIEQSIKEKIEKYGTPLKDWNININYGIKTGCNEAFIINEEKKNELIAKDPKSAEIIRPILRGKDIKRNAYEFANLWLLFIPWHFPLQNDTSITGCSQKAEELFRKEYPAVYEHLLKFKDKLSKRNQAETGVRYEWYALQRWGANYSDDFNKPKLCWTPVNSEYRFAVIDAGIYVNNGIFMITGENLDTLCSILNSDLFIFYFNMLLSTGYQYGSKDVFEDLPVNVEIATKHNLSELDIFRAYHLSEEEISWISESLK